ncbi:hypothetical protein RJ639_021171 [Escallonia herrerae]|uniref:3-hydroxyisobutyryl-CoA hydrolase n=1 Tax=Escallonia herrerae TaxID=1293975 RepID=A0AA89AH34_9ASTE|nr:hypothetical protein RJ639_021171 [Escallonia herrerae]
MKARREKPEALRLGHEKLLFVSQALDPGLKGKIWSQKLSVEFIRARNFRSNSNLKVEEKALTKIGVKEVNLKQQRESRKGGQENEVSRGADKWVAKAINSMKSASPTSLKIFLRSGSRALLFDKDKNPKWQPSCLEQVTEEMVEQVFSKVEDDWFDSQWIEGLLELKAVPESEVSEADEAAEEDASELV